VGTLQFLTSSNGSHCCREICFVELDSRIMGETLKENQYKHNKVSASLVLGPSNILCNGEIRLLETF